MTAMITPPAAGSKHGQSKEPTPVGLLVIGRKRPGFEQEWNGRVRAAAAEGLRAAGFDPVGAEDTPVVDDQTILAALAKVNAAGCQALVVLQPSLGNGQLSLTVEQHWPHPVVLLATPRVPTGG